jgi:putative exporter of polyketide antibiotics
MTSITSTAPAHSTYPAPSFSFTSIIAALFMVNLREKLDAETRGNKTDAKYAYGL